MSDETDEATLPSDWWTATDCAQFLGISRSTWTAYVSRDQAPAHDRMFGRSPAWRPDAVRAWANSRPRRKATFTSPQKGSTS